MSRKSNKLKEYFVYFTSNSLRFAEYVEKNLFIEKLMKDQYKIMIMYIVTL